MIQKLKDLYYRIRYRERAYCPKCGSCGIDDSSPAPCSAWRVTGDHPIMRRPDRVFRGENARERAAVYSGVLEDQGYENVAVEMMPN